MSIILRNQIGRKLTIEEMDGNFTYLDSRSGGYQLLGSAQIDMNLELVPLINPYGIGANHYGDPIFQAGDVINNTTDGGTTFIGTASVVSVQLIESDPLRDATYRIVITNIVGVMYDPLYIHNEWIQANSQDPNHPPGVEIPTYVDMLGPDQTINLSGMNNIIRDVVICKPTTDLTGSGDLQISTEESRGGFEILNTLEGIEYLSLLTSPNYFFSCADNKDIKLNLPNFFISDKLYVTVGTPLLKGGGHSSSLTCLIYGYQID